MPPDPGGLEGIFNFLFFSATVRDQCPGPSQFLSLVFPPGFPSCPLIVGLNRLFTCLSARRPVHPVRVHDIISSGPARPDRAAQKVELYRGGRRSGTGVPDSIHPDHIHSR